MSEETGEIPAVGIPEKYQRECSWGDCPIYACQHCRDNGTFDPKRFNFRPAEELPRQRIDIPMQWHDPAQDKISGPFLSDLEVRKILEGMGVEVNRNPVDEAFQRGRFSRGQGRF